MYSSRLAGGRDSRPGSRGHGLHSASNNVVQTALRELIAKLEDGSRLPTVRDLMKQHRVSQATVQQAIHRLRREGLLTSEVGRGTFVAKGGALSARAGLAGGPALDSLLILSNASLNERCVLVQNHIIEDVSREDSKVVQISYHHTDHLLEILNSIPQFDAVVLQSHYESIPIRLLHLLQQKTRALVVDGHTVSGVDIDRVGTDWEDALQLAVEHLHGLGHRSFGLMSINTMAQPVVAVRRAFARQSLTATDDLHFVPPIVLEQVHHPSHGVLEVTRRALAPHLRQGRLPFTALITLAISDTLGVSQSLQQSRIDIPRDLSLVVLGHTDVPTEHLGTMTIAGSSHREAAQRLVETIRRRVAEPDLRPQITYLRCAHTVRQSTAGPGR